MRIYLFLKKIWKKALTFKYFVFSKYCLINYSLNKYSFFCNNKTFKAFLELFKLLNLNCLFFYTKNNFCKKYHDKIWFS